MPLLDRIFSGDEELGKKDDDHRPGKGAMIPSSWVPRQSMPGFRQRRYFYGLIAILFVYLFVKNLPTDMGPNSQIGESRSPSGGAQLASRPQPPMGQPPRPKAQSDAEKYYYEGPIKFYKLAVSLHAVAGMAGYNGANKNVLFAASGLKSASEIIPLACEMAKWKRNNVHFALMGRDDLDILEIQKLNGVSDDDCNIHWHDARPDYSRWSSNWRMEISVTAGMGYIQTFVHPQIIIIDHESREDGFFMKAIKAKAAAIDKSVIELPSDAAENLMWITRLDSGSLAAWHTTYVDLVIHAPPKSSGSLIRLLKSIEAADYFGARRPHITIELPAEIDPPTSDFLENLVWPPIDWSGAAHASQVTLRHRIPRRRLGPEEASSHLIESFYPARPKDSHVLLLSPQTELSPIYYHFLIYNLLEYKYSTYGQQAHGVKNLMGFSLELPSTYLNGSEDLDPPTLGPANARLSSREAYEPTPFLWEAPNSNAALYFGENWVELHSFLSARTSLQDSRRPADQRPPIRQKIVSESYPSWMEYVQELMRARGYFLLYPQFPNSDDAIVSIHDELSQAPEEYPKTSSRSPPAAIPTLDPNDPFTTDPSAHQPILPIRSEAPLLASNLISLLPYSGDLPELIHLPILSHDGNVISKSASASVSRVFANEFRREIGRCGVGAKIVIQPMDARDLFCNLDQVEGLEPDTMEDRRDEGVDTNGNENVDKGRESSEENVGATEPARPPETKEPQRRKTVSGEGVDKSGDVQGEFSAHLRRQGVKANDAAVQGKTEKETAKPKTPGSRSDTGEDTEKKSETLAGKETKGEVEKETSDKEKELNPDIKKSDAGATAEGKDKDTGVNVESAKRRNEQQQNQGSGQLASKTDEEGGKHGGSEEAGKQINKESKSDADGSEPVEKPSKEAANQEAEVVRDRGW